MKPTGSGLNFHWDMARITSRSKIRFDDCLISTCVTLPLGATCTHATTLPLMPWRIACGGNVGSTRYAALYSQRTAGCGGAGGAGGEGVKACGGGGVFVVVVITACGGGGGAWIWISGGGMNGGGGAASFGGGGGGGTSGGGGFTSSMIFVSIGCLITSMIFLPSPVTSA